MSGQTSARAEGLSPSASRILRLVSMRHGHPASTRSIVSGDTPARRASSALLIIASWRSLRTLLGSRPDRERARDFLVRGLDVAVPVVEVAAVEGGVEVAEVAEFAGVAVVTTTELGADALEPTLGPALAVPFDPASAVVSTSEAAPPSEAATPSTSEGALGSDFAGDFIMSRWNGDWVELQPQMAPPGHCRGPSRGSQRQEAGQMIPN